MTQAIFHPVARRELAAAIAYYNVERQGLGSEFREEVQRVLALLTRFPGLGQPVRGSVRRIMLSRFPYHIYYLLPAPRIRQAPHSGCSPQSSRAAVLGWSAIEP
jgi:hypothetical protein